MAIQSFSNPCGYQALDPRAPASRCRSRDFRKAQWTLDGGHIAKNQPMPTARRERRPGEPCFILPSASLSPACVARCDSHRERPSSGSEAGPLRFARNLRSILDAWGPRRHTRSGPIPQQQDSGGANGQCRTRARELIGRYPAPVFDRPNRNYVRAPNNGIRTDNLTARGDVFSIGYGYTRTFSPSVVNESRFAWNRIGVDRDGMTPREEVIAGAMHPDVTSGTPYFGLAGFTSISVAPPGLGNPPLLKSSAVWNLSDNLSMVKGRHTTELGFDFQLIKTKTSSHLAVPSRPGRILPRPGILSSIRPRQRACAAGRRP